MRELAAQVREFMIAGQQRIGREPGDIHLSEAMLGMSLIEEELRELRMAVKHEGVCELVEIADAVCDLLYVVTWTGLAFGFPLPELMEEVHRSNMAKFKNGVMRDETGKVIKPEGWTPPNIQQILFPEVKR